LATLNWHPGDGGWTAALADEPEVAFPASIAALMKLTFA
jgi:hypothetical protein